MSCNSDAGNALKVSTDNSPSTQCCISHDCKAHTVTFLDGAQQQHAQASGGEGNNLVLIIDETTDSSNLFIDNGYTPVRYSHWSINTGQTNTIGAQLKANKFKMVWIDFPKLSNKPRPYAHMTCLLNWATLCSQLGIPLIMFGSFGKKWDDPQLLAAFEQQQLSKRHHRLCHFGIKTSKERASPSSGCFVTASTVPLPAHACQCSVSRAEHIMDLKVEPGHSWKHQMGEIQADLLKRLLRQKRITVDWKLD